MADSTASGSGSGSGAGGSDEGRPPKRPRVDEQEPEVSSSQPSAEERRQDPPQQQPQQQGPPGQQPAAAGIGRGRGRGIGSPGLLQGRPLGVQVPGLRAPHPGPLIDPLLWSKIPKEKRKRIVKQHKARLERYWDTIIRYYRSMYGTQPTAQPGAALGAQGQGPQLQVQVNIPAAGGQAQQGGIPANAANVVAAGDQVAPDAPELELELAVEDAQDEQAVPEFYGVGGNAEAEPRM